MSEPRFIFNTVDYQNGANTFNNYVNNVNATNNAAATGNSFQFRTDADRMKYLTGTKGKPRLSGYYPGLYATIYRLTVVQNGATLPSINGPGNTGWGQQLWTGPIPDVVNINDTYLVQRTGNGDYLGVQLSGYIYSDIATTIILQTQSDDGSAIYLNGNLVLNAWSYQGPTTTNSASVALNVGYNPIQLLYFEGGGGSMLQFRYSIGGSQMTGNLSCNFVYNYAQM
jgi:hypothetical protein